MLQQVRLMKEREQLFGYKKSAPLISTSCAPHCEKSHLKGALANSVDHSRYFVTPG
jgi:acyl-CoA thioesterase